MDAPIALFTFYPFPTARAETIFTQEFTGTANAKPLDPTKQSLRRGIFKRRPLEQGRRRLVTGQKPASPMDKYRNDVENRRFGQENDIYMHFCSHIELLVYPRVPW